MSAGVEALKGVAEPLVSVRDLVVEYSRSSTFARFGAQDRVRAVDGVSFTISRGGTLGLVGESGCGKTSTGRAVLLLKRPTSGSIRFGNVELTTLDVGALRRIRRRMQLVFQDAYSSFDPRQTVRQILAEPLQIHGLALGAAAQRRRVNELLELVSLAEAHADRHPHELSGGQRQRVGIARALAVSPDLIVCDEPVSALDVSIQAQILQLLRTLQRELGLTYLFISHDLGVVWHVSDRVAVMYLGRIVEEGPRTAMFSSPFHPYTRALLSSVPSPDPTVERNRQRVRLAGEIPSMINPPSGCRFRTRCPFAQAICAEIDPPSVAAAPDHTVACHFWETLPPFRVASAATDQPFPAR